MDERIGRLLAAGNRLKNVIERAQPGLNGAEDGSVANWAEAVELLLDHSAASAGRVPLPPAGERGDFNFLAFDNHSKALLAYGSMAIFALQNADEAHPESSIEILYAGPLGRRIWEQRLGLQEAAPMLQAHFGVP